jgi:anti-sigma factor RsiW
MSHLDEGTLHALLDGELETHEVAEIQAHLNSCSACGLRLREVKEFLAEADRLIAAVDLTPGPAAQRPAAIPAAPSPVLVEAEPRRESAPARPAAVSEDPKWEPWNEPPPPVLLIPDNESASERRMRRMRRFGWAAIIAVIAGAGFVEGRKMMPVALPEDTVLAKSGPVVSPEETAPNGDVVASASRTDSAPSQRPTALADSRQSDSQQANVQRADTRAKPAPPARAPAAAGPVTPATDRTSKAKDAPDTSAPTTGTAESDAGNTAVASRDTDTGTLQTAAQQDEPAPAEARGGRTETAGTEDLATVRARASEALAQLDRERRLKQAAAATAALDAQRRKPAVQSRTEPAAASPPAPAPTPPTLEQRAQIYLRIGLDEASRQLGGPAHVIEGLSPLFMGLVQGTAVSGAEAGRPVVRVVYQDSQGRLILLDQQRLRPGQPTPAASAVSWTMGGTAMWLHGEAPAEILRTFRGRVR